MAEPGTELAEAEGPLADPVALYWRWEAQQWRVQDIDLDADRRQWSSVPHEGWDQLRCALALFTFGEQAVTDALSPILHAAPQEDERLFLATQLADEARHAVFFQRYRAEVLGEQVGDAEVGSESVRTIFHTHLQESIDRVRVAPGDLSAWSEAVVTYHLAIEGYLAVGGQRNVRGWLRATGVLPGLAGGLAAIARDESRHVHFGLVALRRRVDEQASMAGVIAERLLLLARPVVHALVDPASLLRAPGRPGEGWEMRRFVLDSLARRLRLVGLPEATAAAVVAAYRARLKDALAELRSVPAR